MKISLYLYKPNLIFSRVLLIQQQYKIGVYLLRNQAYENSTVVARHFNSRGAYCNGDRKTLRRRIDAVLP